MVRHPERGEAGLQSPDRVLRSADSLDSSGSVPLTAQPDCVLPTEGRIDLVVDEGGEAGGRDLLVDQSVVVGRLGQKVPGPGRSLQCWRRTSDISDDNNKYLPLLAFKYLLSGVVGRN